MLVHNTMMHQQVTLNYAEGYFRNLAWCFCPNETFTSKTGCLSF
jgi:hypothetical protein